MKLDRHTHPLEPSCMLSKNLHPYAHGAGFGMATEILAHSFLAEIFERLEPSRFKACDRILNEHKRVLDATSLKKITLAMENSPVVAALACHKLGLMPIEWDLWLDPIEPESLEKSCIDHGSLFALLFAQLHIQGNYFLKSSLSVSKWVSIYKEAATCFKSISDCKVEKMPSICLDIIHNVFQKLVFIFAGILAFKSGYIAPATWQALLRRRIADLNSRHRLR